MAKKADATVNIPLREAKALLVRAFGSARLAEELLAEELAKDRMPWAYARARGNASPASDREFWRFGPKVDYEEGSGRTMYVPGPSYYGITVSAAHVHALLPEQSGSKAWIAAEARRMKVAGEIPDGIGITDFARLIGKQMIKANHADPTVPLVDWPHIKNNLPTWGLWPVSSI